jgi:hypothetical protein
LRIFENIINVVLKKVEKGIMEKSCETKPEPKNFKEFLASSNFRKPALGIVIGGIIGLAYYSFIGCTSGACAITSNPYSSVLFGSMLGLFVVKRPCSTC